MNWRCWFRHAWYKTSKLVHFQQDPTPWPIEWPWEVKQFWCGRSQPGVTDVELECLRCRRCGKRRPVC